MQGKCLENKDFLPLIYEHVREDNMGNMSTYILTAFEDQMFMRIDLVSFNHISISHKLLALTSINIIILQVLLQAPNS